MVIDLSDIEVPESEEDQEMLREERVLGLVFKALLGDEALMSAAAEILNSVDFFKHHVSYSFMWDMIYEYYHEYSGLPSKAFLIGDLSVRYGEYSEKHPGVFPEETMIQIITEGIDNPPTKNDKKVIRDIIRDHMRGHARTVLEDSENLEEGLKEAEKLLKTDPLSKPKQVELLLPLEEQLEFLSNTIKEPIYVPFLDSMFAGGLAPGSSVGMVIPTGTGKTVLTYQIGYEQAMRGKHTIILTFEQKYLGDLPLRVSVLASGAPRSVWQKAVVNKDLSLIDDEYKNRYLESKPIMEKYIHVVDYFAWDENPLYSIKDLFSKSLEATGLKKEQVSVLIVDWWGPLRNKLLYSMPSDYLRHSNLQRFYMEDCKRSFKTCAQDMGTKCFVFHQVGGGKMGSSSKEQSTTAAQEDTNFNHMFDYCMAASKLNKAESTTVFNMDKARGEKQSSVKVYLDGEYCMFRNMYMAGEAGIMFESMDEDSEEDLDFSGIPDFAG